MLSEHRLEACATLCLWACRPDALSVCRFVGLSVCRRVGLFCLDLAWQLDYKLSRRAVVGQIPRSRHSNL